MKRLHPYVPILTWLPAYRRAWLRDDALAAVSVWALLIPQALAYAAIAGVPVQYGLYTAFAALIAYAIFGTSRQVVQGPSATVAAVSAAVITPIIGAGALNTAEAAKWAAALALVSAVAYIGLGLLRMGWVSNFLSKAVLGGFILGFALGIVIDQAPKLLGVTAGDGSYAEDFVELLRTIPETSLSTLLVGASALAVLLALRYARPKWPRALVVVVLATVASVAFDLSAHGVAVTGDVPTGLFDIGLPGVGFGELGTLAVGSLSIIFVGYSESLAAGRSVARAHDYDLDPDQELIAQGAACGAAGMVGGFVSDGSLSKTSVADAAGQRTQLASLLNAVLVLLTLLLLAGLFEELPAAALGAVVIDAMVGLISFKEVRRYYRVNLGDWLAFVASMIGILTFGIIAGIVAGVVFSLLLLIARASNPRIRELGRAPDSEAYLDEKHHDDLVHTPGVLVVRIDGPLFFADANRFLDHVHKLMRRASTPIEAVVIDCEAIVQTDTDGADIVIELVKELQRDGRRLALARLQHSVRQMWDRAGLIGLIGPEMLFVTVREAVDGVTKPT